MAVEHGSGRALQPFELRSESESLIDESDLLDNIAFCQPLDLPFAYLVHRLIALNRSQCSIHTAKSQTRRDTLFEESMILFEHVV
jgi:hypothetical protein